MLIDKFFCYINNLKKCPVIFLSPCAYAVGNCAEEIFYALLKARRENKKVVLLYPYNLPFWLVKYQLTNRELFKIDSEYIYFRNDSLLLHIMRFFLTLVYLPIRVMSLWLRDYFGMVLNVSYRFPRIGLDNIYQSAEKTNGFSWNAVRSQNWGDQYSEKLSVGLRENSETLGESTLTEMGITVDDWFVCVHARENGFRNDAGSREYRNMEIINYTKAFERITEKGGWVIRMGDDTMTKLPKMNRVIDYPFTKFASDLMDVYLIKKCRYYLGCQSGILDIALLFQKPVLLVNMYCWISGYPMYKNSRGIVKHFYSHSKKRILTIKEMFEGPWEMQDNFRTVSKEYELYENSVDEIEEAVVEYMNLLESKNYNLSDLQTEANKLRNNTSYHFFDTVKFKDVPAEELMIENYRLAVKIEDSKGAICQKFLEKNWK
jgi:putative glycosyltransferase (TIGR04372 family)